VRGAEFSEVDIDLLADYVGGALDGTPDETAVATLIAENTAWRDAHALLSGGVTAVTGHLRALGEIAEPMPLEVFARLDAALLTQAGELAAAGEVRTAATDQASTPIRATRTDATAMDAAATAGATSIGASAGEVTPVDTAAGATAGGVANSGVTPGVGAMEPGSDGAAPGRHLVAVPSGSRSGRARRLRWAAPVGIAAGVIAFAGFGLQQQFATQSSEDSAGSAGAPRAAAERELALPNGVAQVVESGTDYRPETLARSERTMIGPAPAPEPVQESPSRLLTEDTTSAKADATLDRLRAQAALRACIEAIAAEHGAGEITAQTVDLARFNGAPAVIVRFAAAGAEWVWAAGPACGTPGVGADKLAAVQVG